MIRVNLPMGYRITTWYIAITVTLCLIAEVVRWINP